MSKTSVAPTPIEISTRTRRTVFGANDTQASVSARHSFASEREPRSALPAASEVTVTAVMTHDVVCVTADLSIEALRTILIERNISGVPVVDSEGMPVGMISKTDLILREHDAGDTGESEVSVEADDLEPGFHVEPARETVASYMVPLAFTLNADAPLAHAAALMAWEGVHRIPVCSAEGDVVGIITALDIVRWVAGTAGYPARR